MNKIERYKRMRLPSLEKEIISTEDILKFLKLCPLNYREIEDKVYSLNCREIKELQDKLANLESKKIKLTNFPFNL